MLSARVYLLLALFLTFVFRGLRVAMLARDLARHGGPFAGLPARRISRHDLEEIHDLAVKAAIKDASKTVRNMDWFEVDEMRGRIKDGQVAEFQVTLKIGFRMEDPNPA